MPPNVLYLDNHLLVVVKPPGTLVQADRTGDPDLLSAGKEYLRERFSKPGNVFLGLVHRLDRPASGIVVFGRTSKAASRLSDQFRRRTPDKRYVAIVEGNLTGATTLLHHLVKRDERVEVVSAQTPGAKRAEMYFDALAGKDGLTLLDVRLITGRPHQVRVQCAAKGHPVLGDARYGARRQLDGRNLALHSYSLGVVHPTLGKWISWQAAPPVSWGGLFDEAIASVVQQAAAERDRSPISDAH